MKIVEKKIKDLIFAEYNPRKASQEQYEQTKSSLLRFDCIEPVIVNTHPDRKNIIVGGHQRCKLWKEIGHDTIPCVEVNLPLEKEKELNIRLNKNTGDWDKDILGKMFDPKDLLEWGFNIGEIKIPDIDESLANSTPSINSEIEGDIKFSVELDEKSNYVVLKFDKDIDILQIQTLLGLESVYSRNSQGKASKMGIGRVVDGVRAIERIQNARA